MNRISNGSIVTQTNELFFFSTSYLGIGLLICTAIALIMGRKWLITFMVLVLSALSYILVKLFVLNLDFIINQAPMEEHLISPLYASVIALMTMIAFALISIRKQFFP